MTTNDEEKVLIEIPKYLFDRLNSFCNNVQSEIVREMTEWVEIMEDEERLAEQDVEKRFKVYCVESVIPSFSYTEVINTRQEDKNNAFVGTFSGICSKESILTIAREGYGIDENEIEFICSQ